MIKRKYQSLAGLFLISLTLFFYQLIANRLFSVILSNQYSYLVISFSILGLGIGGILVYYLFNKNKFNLKIFLIVYLFTYLASITLIFMAPYLGSPIWYIILGMIPFIFGGGIISYLFKIQSNTYLVYFIDLIGGISGLLTAMLLMTYLGTIQAIVISFIFLLILFIVLNFNKRNLAIILPICLLIILGFGNIVSYYQNNFNSFLSSPYVGFGEHGEFKFSSWDSFAKTDVLWNEMRPNEMIVGLNGRAFSRIIQFDGDLSKVEYLKNRIGYLPFELGSPEKVAIIGSGGGEEIIYSFLAGIEDITAIEINPGTINASRELADFSGNIYEDQRVKTVIGDGRSFIRNTNEKYDQIYLGLVMTNIGDNVANTLSENFIFTEEALGDYFDKLSPGGNLSFLFHASNDLTKMLTTSISYFEKLGISHERIVDHFVIFGNQHTNMYPILMIKAEPFTPMEVMEINLRVEENNFVPIHMPGFVEERILNQYRRGDISLEGIIDSSPINLAVTTDNKPFFYHMQRGNPRTLLVIILGSLSILLIIFLITLFKKNKMLKVISFKTNFIIFILLGMAFMFIQISLIQKMSVFLEHPTTSFVTIVTVILLGAGMANFVQLKKELFTDYTPLLYLSILSIVELLLINHLIYWQGFNSFISKIAVVTALLLPLGFLMGIPFPMVLKKLQKQNHQSWVPYFWGVDGIASVLGSALTITISLQFGFNISFIIGVVLYIFAALIIRKLDFNSN
ncbi:spermine/spermidine synthase domain-containing protein [Natronospora cellulosivora (SeqCode)]